MNAGPVNADAVNADTVNAYAVNAMWSRACQAAELNAVDDEACQHQIPYHTTSYHLSSPAHLSCPYMAGCGAERPGRGAPQLLRLLYIAAIYLYPAYLMWQTAELNALDEEARQHFTPFHVPSYHLVPSHTTS